MKNKIVLLISFITLIACGVKKQVAQYEFPEAMLPHVKTEYVKLCDKGQVLYNISCARCHDVLVKHKKIIPDFRTEKLGGYVLSNTSVQHEAALSDTMITVEELGDIITFLTYKKKNGMLNKLISVDGK